MASAALLCAGPLWAALLWSAPLAQADDTSDFDGTKCNPEQFYDATVERCQPALVTNDPKGEPQPQDIGANWDGTKCDGGLFYNGSDALCTLDAITNDPKIAETLQSGNPLDSNLPTGPA